MLSRLNAESMSHIKKPAVHWVLWPQHRFRLPGALYPDNTTGLQKEDDRLQPGAEYTYVWFVEENQGPGPNDSNCVTRMYHSHVDTLKDVSSGLLGPILTCKRGNILKISL